MNNSSLIPGVKNSWNIPGNSWNIPGISWNIPSGLKVVGFPGLVPRVSAEG